ncbi:MAG TPA: TonB-dependent receptor [Chitinophagaceae bacterium]|jgi:hypothetical protein|nr:TonB-dependent receptor [Chitinophagaceae bacterium]
MKHIILIALLVFAFAAHAQYTQQLRGSVVDQVLQTPLQGATVAIPLLNKSAITDEQGSFRFNDIPVGTYRIVVTYTGFREITLDNIIVNSGKETVLTIPTEALVRSESEVIVKANSKKNKPLNDMSAVSARAFTVEETQKYAAAVNDPLRMATAFPGVLAGDDGNNSIIIRGNAPGGLLWKMEGMDIPNPNHFSNLGTSGGGISILSSQLLANSDFVTGAFAAEYGNATSGVFDLKLRKGNNEKREYTIQAGVLGLNAAMEGPFSKKYKGSYLVNYRYSTLQLLGKIGVIPNDAATNFQDLSYNVYLPTNKLGNFSLFGFGGLSSEKDKADKDSTKWEEKEDRYTSEFTANTAMAGATHSILLGKKINVKTGVGVSYTRNAYDEDFMEDDYSLVKRYNGSFKTRRLMLNSTMNYKFNNRLTLRAGVNFHFIKYNYYQLSAEHEGDPLEVMVDTKGKTATQQAFAQWQYKVSDNFTVNAGMHYLRLSLNKTSAAEPRLSAKWNISNKSSIAVGYGLHSQLQGLGVYFGQEQLPGGGYSSPNKQLGFNKAHHYVVSYNQRVAKNLIVKAELYYQSLFNIAIDMNDTSTFAVINHEDQYILDPLQNKGKGKNYGLELSIERYLQDNFYLTLSQSFYQSKYTARDGVERNTRYNGGYIGTFIAGKDFPSARRSKTFGVHIKAIGAGGLRTTPIDFDQSQLRGYTVYKESQAYSLQNEAYFRADIRLSIKWNRRNLTSTLSLDIQNVTNRENVYNQTYDETKNKIVTNRQVGLIPVLNYKVEF